MKRYCFTRALLFFAFVLAAGKAAALDFGLVLSPGGEYVSDTAGEGAGFTGTLTPWFSAALGDTVSLYLSGKLGFEYEYEHQAWAAPFLVELDRTELSFRPARRVYLNLGRQRVQDGGGMILSGLFDGLSGSFGLGGGRLSLGAFYTGFLYKKSAEILMTAEDRDRYGAALDYGDLDSYFASRRVLVSSGIEVPEPGSRLSLALEGLAQFDLNGEGAYHSQYLEARAGIEAAESLRFTVTGIGALGEQEGQDVRAQFAAALGADWDVPGTLKDMVQGELRWGSGEVNRRIGAFRPVNGISQGTVFSAALGGVMNTRLSYTARPEEGFSFSLGAACFWRTDVETLSDAELDGASGKRFLGTEASGSLVWAVQSALRVTAGGGAFFPGGAFVKDAKIRWKVNGGLALSL
ncbi:MAG: hypothetical protein LBL43_00515 [Treponema sp.]|jgi:hypothetical protein|nr:hypothetical protein [Treponema sp.]